MNTSKIEDVIEKGDYPESTTGGCVSFAIALDNVFDAEGFPCAFDPMDDSKPLHCMAIIDGMVFDGNGKNGTDPTIVQNWWSGLRLRDFPNVGDDELSEKENYEMLYEWLENEYYFVYDSQNMLENLGAVEKDVKMYESTIRQVLD